MLDAVVVLETLRIPPSNHFEALHGDREGQYSIRINLQWRICFTWHDGHRMMWKSLITIKEVNHDPNRKSYSSRRDSRGRVLETDEHQPEQAGDGHSCSDSKDQCHCQGIPGNYCGYRIAARQVFRDRPEFWINLQANYDLCVAAAQSEKEIAAIPQLAPA